MQYLAISHIDYDGLKINIAKIINVSKKIINFALAMPLILHCIGA